MLRLALLLPLLTSCASAPAAVAVVQHAARPSPAEQHRAAVAEVERVQQASLQRQVDDRRRMMERIEESNNPGPVKRRKGLAKLREQCPDPEPYAQCGREVLADALHTWAHYNEDLLPSMLEGKEKMLVSKDSVASLMPEDYGAITPECEAFADKPSKESSSCLMLHVVQAVDDWLAMRPNLVDDILEERRKQRRREVYESGWDLISEACSALGRKHAAKERIEADKRAAKHSGVPDYGLRQQAGRDIVEADEDIRRARTEYQSRLNRGMPMEKHCR